MKIKVTASFVATLVMLLSLAFSAWAQVPPPPVNQKLFIPDTTITGITEAGCRSCHDNPAIVPAPGNVDRHHLKVGQTPPANSVRPFPARDTNGTYDCFSCHDVTVGPAGPVLVNNYRNCLNCHNTGSPHHSNFGIQNTPTSVQANCQRCHGSVIENPPTLDTTVPAWIPTYAPSLVTPWTSGKDVANNTTGVTGADGIADLDTRGNCIYCHAAGSVTDPAFLGPFGAVPNVVDNQTSHHATGFGGQLDKCFWCHGNPVVSGAQKIRKCENCHSIATLHNIQADSDAAANLGTIVPAQENLGWGHVGNNWDCNGCHGFTATAASTLVSGSLLPSLDGMSIGSVKQGVPTTVTVSGQAFINEVDFYGTKFAYQGQIKVTDANGVAQTLLPTAVTSRSLEYVMPADLAAGSYKVQIVKAETQLSNALTINVVPETRITKATCADSQLVVEGTGFGVTPPAVTELGAFMNGVQAKVTSWSDNRVVATGTCDSNVALKSAFGTVTATATVTVPPVVEPPVILPAITKLSTTSTRVGSRVTIYGTNLGSSKGTVNVGTASATVKSWSNTSISFYVPKVSRGTYNVSVTNAKGTSGSLSLRVR